MNKMREFLFSFFFCFNVLQSVEGMKVVCHELAQASNDPEESAIDELVKDADGLVSCLANKVCLNKLSLSICHEELLPIIVFADHHLIIFVFC